MFDFDDLSEGEEAEAPAAPPAADKHSQAAAADQDLRQRLLAEAEACSSRNDVAKWCMKYAPLGFPLPAGSCRCRIFCFHNAGSAESVYTGPAQNPVITWVKADPKKVEIVAVSYPGRDKMLRDDKHQTCDSLNTAMLPVLLPLMTDGVPFVFWGHSVGTWVAYELVRMMQKCDLPMPQACIFAAFPGPNLPEADRPWRVNRPMSSAVFADEVKGWDAEHFGGAAKVVFEEPGWTETWEPLMRADFRLFDEYTFRYESAPKLPFPIHGLAMDGDTNIRPEMVQKWGDLTDSFHFEILRGMGHLTSAYQPPKKKEYYGKVLEAIQRYCPA